MFLWNWNNTQGGGSETGSTAAAAADKGKAAATTGAGTEYDENQNRSRRTPYGGVSDAATASSMWRHLVEVMSVLTAGKDPKTAATLIHLVLGPNTFYMTLRVQGSIPDPVHDEDFWALFDLDNESALDYAEEMSYKDIANHWESFDTNLSLFTAFFSHMLPTMSRELGVQTIGGATVSSNPRLSLLLLPSSSNRDVHA